MSDVVIQAAERHPRLVEHDFLTPNQLGSRLDRRWIATPAKPARNDRGWLEHAAFTMAARLSRSTESVAERLPQLNPSKNLAFTMAEILLSLTIIGVVAAITLPSLTGNINERTWNTQRKALYARMSQALPLMDALNGYGTVTEATSSSSAIDNAAETFVTAGLSKAFKINNICAHDKLHDCGIASKIVSLKGNNINTSELTNLGGLNSELVVPNTANSTVLNTYSLYDTNAAAFETANGESIIVYYNPTCTGSLGETTYNQSTGSAMGGFNIHPWVCANFIYDLNGNKGPNTVGKDIGFMTAFYPYDAILYAPYPAPSPISGSYTRNQVKKCTEYDPDYRAPKANELASMFVNKKLIDADSYTENNTGGGYITTETEVLSSGNIGGITQRVDTGFRDAHGVGALWCVKR